MDRDGNLHFCFPPQTSIIASGGIGRIYRKARMPPLKRVTESLHHGAPAPRVENMEFVQFHPTALIHPDKNGRYFPDFRGSARRRCGPFGTGAGNASCVSHIQWPTLRQGTS